MVSDTPQPNERYKVGRVLTTYDLLGLHGELPDLWLGETGESTSVRDLAERINVALVGRAMENAGEDPLDGEAENAYRLLTADDVSAGVRTQQRNRLERAGVDVDDLEADFVSHQSVYNYLTKGLGLSKDRPDGRGSVEKHHQQIQRLRSRTTAVIESSLAELQRHEHLSLGAADVTVAFRVYCRDCGTQYELGELLREGRCNCQDAPDRA